MSDRRGLFGFLRGDSKAVPRVAPSNLTAEPTFAEPAAPQTSAQPATGMIPAQPTESPVPQFRDFPSSPLAWPQARLDGDSDVKIVVTGPFAAGKTTMATKLGGPGAQVHTETHVSDETAALKAFTTVSLDFASVLVPPPPGQAGTPTQVQLFGTPGQERFEFMWRVLAKGMRGYVVLVDTSRQFSVDDARLILKRFREISPDAPFVIGVSRWTGKGDPQQLARYLGVDSAKILDLMREVDVREESQSMELLQFLLSRVPTEPMLVH